jgi:DNA-binding transcriptional ArsR family regulator
VTEILDDRHPTVADLRLSTVLGALTISRSTFSHHQRILREAGLLHERIRGAQRILALRRAELDGRFPGLLDAVLGPRTRPSRPSPRVVSGRRSGVLRHRCR